MINLIKDGCVLFIGSGVSTFKEVDGADGLPSGYDISIGILEKLFPEWRRDPIFWELIKDTPFENILENRPLMDTNNIIASHYSSSGFNIIHLYVAKMAKEGVIRSVITTNYDVCLENAIRYVGLSDYNLFIKFEDVRKSENMHNDVFNLFKIHGCSSDADTICSSLTSESRLPDWKYDVFVKLTSGRRLVIAGFSGRDFDICPVLFSISMYMKKIFWIEPSENISRNLDYAIREGIATRLHGNFNYYFNIEGDLQYSSGSSDVIVDDIVRMSDKHRQVWRYSLLYSISLNVYSRKVFEECIEGNLLTECEKRMWEAEIFARSGRYRSAYNIMIELFYSSSKLDSRIASERFMYMAIGYLYTGRWRVEFLFNLIKYTILLYWLYNLEGFLYFWGLSIKALNEYVNDSILKKLYIIIRPLSYFAIVILNFAARLNYKKGNWKGVYLCAEQILDLGGFMNLTSYGKKHTAMRSVEGYKNMNSYIGFITASRKHNKDLYNDIVYVYEVVKNLFYLELYPGVWLICRDCYCRDWWVEPALSEEVIEMAIASLQRSEINERLKSRWIRKFQSYGKDRRVS